jgi:hypothetical protein
VYRKFGDPTHRGVVYFLGAGFLEISGTAEQTATANPCSGCRCETSTLSTSGWRRAPWRFCAVRSGSHGASSRWGRRPRRRPHRAGRGP